MSIPQGLHAQHVIISALIILEELDDLFVDVVAQKLIQLVLRVCDTGGDVVLEGTDLVLEGVAEAGQGREGLEGLICHQLLVEGFGLMLGGERVEIQKLKDVLHHGQRQSHSCDPILVVHAHRLHRAEQHRAAECCKVHRPHYFYSKQGL